VGALPGFAGAPVTPENVDRFAAGVTELHPRLGSACRALSRLTITPSLVAGGVKSNSVPELAALRCDLRCLPSQDAGYLERELARLAAAAPGARVTLEPTALPSQSPADPGVMALLAEATRRATGRDAELLPALNPGFTDSRFARDLGIPAYGFTPGHPDGAEHPRNIHGPDEWISLDDLVTLTRFFIAAVLLFDAGEAGER
jgi:acetylornithine deacetylase/succinyl-diaminopimelate desuccinylase-like protein